MMSLPQPIATTALPRAPAPSRSLATSLSDRAGHLGVEPRTAVLLASSIHRFARVLNWWAAVGRFHEGAQDPEYRDGEAVEEDFPSAEQLKHLKRLFEQGDTDGSGTLSKAELAQVLKHADGMAGESSLSDDEIEMISWQLFDDQDVDKDMQLTLQEWNQGGGYMA